MKFPLRIKSGAVTVTIYQAPNRGYESFMLTWQEGRKRFRKRFRHLKSAQAAGRQVADALARQEGPGLTLTGSDRAEYLDALDALRPFNLSLISAIREFAEAKRVLGETPLVTAAAAFAKAQGQLPPIAIPSAVDAFIEHLHREGRSTEYVRVTRIYLERFARDVSMPLNAVTSQIVAAWADGLTGAPRTRKNYRSAVEALLAHAAGRLQARATRTHTEDVKIFTPAELRLILDCCPERALPAVAIGAFAGVRSAEIERLSWEDVHTDNVIVGAAKAKTRQRRLVPVLPALRAWLDTVPEANRVGPIYAGPRFDRELEAIEKAVKEVSPQFRWKKNGLRHSWISYRVAATGDVQRTALEAGNSPQIIFSNYRELASEAEAREWFTVGR